MNILSSRRTIKSNNGLLIKSIASYSIDDGYVKIKITLACMLGAGKLSKHEPSIEFKVLSKDQTELHEFINSFTSSVIYKIVIFETLINQFLYELTIVTGNRSQTFFIEN